MKTKIFHDYVLHTRLVNNFYQSFEGRGGEGGVSSNSLEHPILRLGCQQVKTLQPKQ